MATVPQQKAADVAFQFQMTVARKAKRVVQRLKGIVALLKQARAIEDKALAQKFFLMRGHCKMMLDALGEERDLLHNTDIMAAKSAELSAFLEDIEKEQSRFDTFARMYTGMKAKALPLLKAKKDQFDAKLVAWFLKDQVTVAAFDAQFQQMSNAVEQAVE
jgi:hypothetical protein